MPQHMGSHSTVIKWFIRFLKELAAGEGRRDAAVPQYPSDETLMAFVGYMLEQKSLGGATVQGYIGRLPTALAMYHGQPPHAPKLTLSKALRTVIANAARRVASIRELKRDPATAETIAKIAADTTAQPLVKAAVVVQYHLGARGINIYSTSKSRENGSNMMRPLQWRDVTYMHAFGSHPASWKVVLRMEKTASTHVGTFAPKFLVCSPNPAILPCPVEALQVAMKFRSSRLCTALVFPSVTDLKVNSLLARHSTPGRSLTTHSLRAGRVSDISGADLPEHARRMAGNWKADAMADRYASTLPRQAMVAHQQILQSLMAAGSSKKATMPSSAASVMTTTSVEHGHRDEITQLEARERSLTHEVGSAVLQVPNSLSQDSAAAASAAVRQPGSTVPQPGEMRTPTRGVPRVLLLVSAAKGRMWGYFYASLSHERISLVANPGTGQKVAHASFNLEELTWLVSNSTPFFAPKQNSELEHDRQVVLDLVERGRKHQKLPAPETSRRVTRAIRRQSGAEG